MSAECNINKEQAKGIIKDKSTTHQTNIQSNAKQVVNANSSKQNDVNKKIQQIPTNQNAKQTIVTKHVKTTPTTTGQYIITANALNVRSLPRQDSRVLGTLRKGTIVSIVIPTSPTLFWKRIKFGKTYGWVSAKYIKEVR
jgi:uncharacterized protein YgiM (DUF1202 family)